MITNLLSNAKLAWASLLFTIDFFVQPTINLFGILFGAIFIDFITGVIKAKFKKEARTSEGYRKTLVKVLQYIGPVGIIWFLSTRLGQQNAEMLKSIAGWIMLFIIYIEVTSIFENLYEIDKKSVIAKFIYRPALVVLKFGLENNAVSKAAAEIKNKNNSDEKNNE